MSCRCAVNTSLTAPFAWVKAGLLQRSAKESWNGTASPGWRTRNVVIPGTVPKKFPAGEYGVPCALIIGQRKESTDKKTSLNDALREHSVAV